VPVQAGQVIVPPQPLLTGPQSEPPPLAAHASVVVNGTQTLTPLSFETTAPSLSVVTFDDPQTFGVPAPPHSSPAGQPPPSATPQVTRPPHPSAITPQFIGFVVPGTMHAVAAVAGTHAAVPPHTFGVPGVPPPQVVVPVQTTQGFAMTPPQPSACWPQRPDTEGSEQVLGTQAGPPPQTLGVPPPPHDCPEVQSPH
jgi:hypothetical protein